MDYTIKGVDPSEYLKMASERNDILRPIKDYVNDAFIPEREMLKPDFKYNPKTGEIAIFFDTASGSKPAFDDIKLTNDEKIAAVKLQRELLYRLQTYRKMQETWV